MKYFDSFTPNETELINVKFTCKCGNEINEPISVPYIDEDNKYNDSCGCIICSNCDEEYNYSIVSDGGYGDITLGDLDDKFPVYFEVWSSKLLKNIIDFSIEGYKRTEKLPVLKTVPKQEYELKDRNDNFFGCPHENFKFDEHAALLTSSQAFAHNIFSGVKNVEFEYGLWALTNEAWMDVVLLPQQKNVIQMFEIKMFEIRYVNRISFADKYFCKNYYRNKQIADTFIEFIKKVKFGFKNRDIYGKGIKQLCSHLLGIINEMEDGKKLTDKNVELYSLCFDGDIGSDEFRDRLQNYKNILDNEFKPNVEELLKEIKMDDRIKYCGFLGVKDYIDNNIDLLGFENVEYVKNRYFWNEL